MSATNLAKASRFAPRTKSRCVVAATLANPATPTRAELDAADDVSTNLTSAPGWKTRATYSDEGSMDGPQNDKVLQSSSYEDSSLVFHADKAGVANIDIQLGNPAPGDTLFVMFLDHGDVPTTPMEVFEVEVATIPSRDRGSSTLLITYDFAILNRYSNVPVPATA